MPQIPYYLGRPASFWIAVMSRHAPATAAFGAAKVPLMGMIGAVWEVLLD
jgi:hypothetical protein